MTNSLYPSWMRKPNEDSFAEKLEKQGFEESRIRKEKEKSLWVDRLKNRRTWCWRCNKQGLDGRKHDICGFCNWIICPDCNACNWNCPEIKFGKRVRWTEVEGD